MVAEKAKGLGYEWDWIDRWINDSDEFNKSGREKAEKKMKFFKRCS